MKSLGARSGQIIQIYLLQTLLLGLLGGLIGVGLGVGVQLAFPVLLAKLINLPTEVHIQLRTVLTGLGAGVLTTLLFTLPPLLDIRRMRPILILRRAVEEDRDPVWPLVLKHLRRWALIVAFTVAFAAAGFLLWRLHAHGGRLFTAAHVQYVLWPCVVLLVGDVLLDKTLRARMFRHPAQIAAFVFILAGLAAIATTLSDSATVGKVFSLGLVGVLAVLLAASAAVLAALKYFLNRTRLALPSTLRHGLANLYRPGNPSAALLAALGLGVMQIMTVFLVQQAVVKELHLSSAPNLPNVFLIDVTSEEVAGVRALLKSQKSVTSEAGAAAGGVVAHPGNRWSAGE